MANLPIFFLVASAIGGLAWVFIYPILSGEKKAEKRRESMVRVGPSAPVRTARNLQKPRREQIEATLKQVEPGHFHGATYVVFWSVAAHGTTTNLECRLVRLRTAEIIASTSAPAL